MMNGVFGKAMENKRNHANVDVITDKTKAQLMMSKPTVKTFHIFEEYLTLFQRKKMITYFQFNSIQLSTLLSAN